ncbi:hypothetical protein VAR608DRAFT_5545 [Variovorax sp. HW608]|uniref:hypothetical protein n=1 Tax=Variovorax sp. HW608 TaxID=1034889 RepID=UPI0008201FBC|nr:hypothetical protein [Variovorax sp. HW608]SCK54347.1 hypothetical protein VAR608DRAFT_5545 [Variovorax sp. HW608]
MTTAHERRRALEWAGETLRKRDSEAVRMQARRLRDDPRILSALDVYTHLVGVSEGTRASSLSTAA